MASTSSNTSPVPNNVCRYDVFLSFRGETRHAFTDHLCTALLNAGLIPFIDNDDTERGEDLKPEIERGIRESRASIVILSENYATSRWCLDELALILEQATKRRHFVLPIFYHVDPSHVRNQVKSFEIKVECNTKWTEENVERWKTALKKVGNITGEVPSGSETKFLEKVVGIIEKRLNLKKVYRKANLVGMDNWQKEIDNWLEESSAQILAIWGMGGIGKTTLARHIVYSNWENFGSISILEDIGSKSTEQLHELQQKLLRDILQGKKRQIPSVWQGTCKIENALKTEKAIIVLDNILEPGHLFLLLGDGSETKCKIIITTRERNPQWFDQSTSWRCQYLEMKSLDMNDSLELLSLHAFGSKAPTEGYDHLVEKALRYCEGNPLALEVLGSSLSQNNKQLWESRLNSFETELHARIHGILIGSYESLPLDCDRELFLHIACFFVGKDMDYVVKVLEPDYSALSGIETLFKRCLLSVSPDKKLMMHRMLQELARTIVYKESPKNPAKRTRVWRDKESYDILLEGKGSKKIEGLALDIKLLNQGKELYEYESTSNLTTESFKKMEKLKLLQLNYVDLTGSYENFSKQLRWLCWTGFSLRAIPSDLCMKNLVAIDMSYSCLEEFEPPTHLHSLKILNLRSSKYLREICNIYRLRNLEILILWDCTSLTHVTTLGGLTCLAILNITGCEKLCTREETSLLVSQEGSSLHAIESTQQASFLLPQSLERLFSSSCKLSDTDYFPLTFNDQPLLIYLNLVNGLFTFLPSYNYLKRLRVLDVSGCNNLKELRCLPSTLAELYIYYCNSLNIVTFESHRFTLQEFGYEGCVNLCEVEGLFKLMPVNKLEESDLKHISWIKEYHDLQVCLVGDVELTKGRSSCVQMLYEFNIVSTSLPNIKNSNMMTDTDYMYTSQSTLLSFKVPAFPEHRRLEGLSITFQYTAHGEDWIWFVKISTSNGVNLMYNPRVFGKPDEVGIWSSYWPFGKSLQIEETVSVSIIVIKGLLDIHWCGANLAYTDEGASEPLQVNQECVAILGDDFSEFQLSTGAYYLCRRDFFELMEAGKLTPDWFRILVDNKINYIEIGGWRMTGKPGHPYQSYTELKTIRCIMYGPEMEGIYKIAELSKSSVVDKTMESTSELSKAKPMDISVASTTSSHYDTIECSDSVSDWSTASTQFSSVVKTIRSTLTAVNLDEDGEKKSVINPELWQTCAGPLVNLPAAGTLVVYFPQGHSEQVAAYIKKDVDSQIPNYPNLQSKLLCILHNVTLHADPETDEVYAQMTLQPVSSFDKEALLRSDLSMKINKPQTQFYCKTLTASDTSTHSGCSVPRRAAERIFPPLDFSMQPAAQVLVARDLNDTQWTFCHTYRGPPRRHLLTTGWSLFVSGKRLFAGDSVLFIRDENQQLVLGIRRANRQPTNLSSSVLSSDSMHFGILAAAAHAAANSSPFTVFYNPRVSPSEFVIPLAKYYKAVFRNQISLGMRFRMMFETEESGTRRYMGTITGISDLDAVRWKNSQWRNLEVGWDESTGGERRTRVSVWEIEPVTAPFFICPTPPLYRPKRPRLPGLPDDESADLDNLFKRTMPWLGADLPTKGLGLSAVQWMNMQQSSSLSNPLQTYYSNSLSGSVLQNYGMPQMLTQNNLQFTSSRSTQLDQLQKLPQSTTMSPLVSMMQPRQLLNDPSQQLIRQNSINQTLPQNQMQSQSHPQNVMKQQSSMKNHHLYGNLQQQQQAMGASQNQQNSLLPPQFSDHQISQQLQMPDNQTPLQLLQKFHQQQQSLLAPQSAPQQPDDQQKSMLDAGQSLSSQGLKSQSQGFFAPMTYLNNMNGSQMDFLDSSSSATSVCVPPNDLHVQNQNHNQLSSNSQPAIQDDEVQNVQSGVNITNHMGMPLMILDPLSKKDMVGPSKDFQNDLSPEGIVQPELSSSMVSQSFGVPNISFNPIEPNLSDSALLNNDVWAPPPQQFQRLRTYAMVYKRGAVGISIDISAYTGYEGLKQDLARRFGIEGQLEDRQEVGWKLVYVDHDNDVLLVGDDPWEEFVSCVRCIKILSPQEDQQMSLDGDFGGNSVLQNQACSSSNGGNV